MANYRAGRKWNPYSRGPSIGGTRSENGKKSPYIRNYGNSNEGDLRESCFQFISEKRENGWSFFRIAAELKRSGPRHPLNYGWTESAAHQLYEKRKKKLAKKARKAERG